MGFSEDFFTIKKDPYNGVTINKDQLPNTQEEFALKLAKSLERWKQVNNILWDIIIYNCYHQEKVRGIWLNIGIEKSEFIPKAVELGIIILLYKFFI